LSDRKQWSSRQCRRRRHYNRRKPSRLWYGANVDGKKKVKKERRSKEIGLTHKVVLCSFENSSRSLTFWLAWRMSGNFVEGLCMVFVISNHTACEKECFFFY
jgi:hypothetical protein